MKIFIKHLPRIIFLFTCLVSAHKSSGQKIDFEPIINHVYRIYLGGTMEGTGFFVNIDNQDYIVTAEHIFPDDVHHGSEAVCTLMYDGYPEDFKGTALFASNREEIDIGILRLHSDSIPYNAFQIDTSYNFSLGQDAFILGYPWKLGIKEKGYMDRNSIPFLSKGVISSWSTNDSCKVIYLDLVTNGGNSGGPAFVFDDRARKRPRLIGVVFENELKISHVVPVTEERHYIKENSGISKVISSKHILEIINRSVN